MFILLSLLAFHLGCTALLLMLVQTSSVRVDESRILAVETVPSSVDGM